MDVDLVEDWLDTHSAAVGEQHHHTQNATARVIVDGHDTVAYSAAVELVIGLAVEEMVEALQAALHHYLALHKPLHQFSGA